MSEQHDALASSTPSPTLAFLEVLAITPDAGRFLDVRWLKRPGAMRRRFVSAHRLADAAALMSELAVDHDVYVGVALRDGARHGGRAAISAMHLAYIESDHADTAERLANFAHPPTMVVASGTPGHHQVYWLLDEPRPPAQVETVNRRLAVALGGDPACFDAARILRSPGTLNHKHTPPRAVSLLVLRRDARYRLVDLTTGLPEDPSPPTDCSPEETRVRTPLDTQLRAIPAAEYVRVLAGLTPNADGKVRCPFHADTHPSLHVYSDGGFYCFGSGCRAGGTIYDFAARLWGIAPRGAGFIEIRERLAQTFELPAGESW